MEKPKLILSTKLTNAIKRNPKCVDYTFHLKNILVNGQKRGCSGFVKNESNGSIVYINTEQSPLMYSRWNHFLYRYADHLKDYSGYSNHFADTLEELADSVCRFLEKTPAVAGDSRI